MTCHYEGCNRKAGEDGLCFTHANPDVLHELWNRAVEEFRSEWLQSAAVLDAARGVLEEDDTQPVQPFCYEPCAWDGCPLDAVRGMYCEFHAKQAAKFTAPR